MPRSDRTGEPNIHPDPLVRLKVSEISVDVTVTISGAVDAVSKPP
jgi:hypothetical protein